MKWSAILAVTAVLALPASAQAGWRIDRATAIAQIVWHHPCGDQVALTWALLPADTAGEALVHPCEVRLSADRPLAWPAFCKIVLHEYGHLAGAGHSLNYRSVMYEQQDAWADPRCAKRGRPYLARHV